MYEQNKKIEWKAIEDNDKDNDCFMISSIGQVCQVKKLVYANGEWLDMDVKIPVNVYKDGRVRLNYIVKYMHILMAKHFVPNPENKKHVRMKDGDKTNIQVDNLYWSNHRHNIDGVATVRDIKSKAMVVVYYQLNDTKYVKSFRYIKCGCQEAIAKANTFIDELKLTNSCFDNV